MEAGRFKISSDAILRVRNKLANGQHRLMAVVQSGKAQSFIVMESNDDELYKVIDAGLRRSVSDSLIGIVFAKSLPAIARWVQAYEEKMLRPSARSGSDAMNRDYTPTQCEQIDYCIGNHEILSEAAAFVNPMYSETKLLPLSIGGAMYVIASSHDGYLESAKTFLVQVYLEGGKTAAGDLRNRLIVNRGGRSKLNLGYVFGITLKAFKAFHSGTRPGTLKWQKDEPFPVL